MQKSFGRRRDEINDYWNGSACDERDRIWPYWVVGALTVTIIATVATLAVGRWGVQPQLVCEYCSADRRRTIARRSRIKRAWRPMLKLRRLRSPFRRSTIVSQDPMRSARGVARAASQIDLQLLKLGDALIDAPLPYLVQRSPDLRR
jgi:hypothetical protein